MTVVVIVVSVRVSNDDDDTADGEDVWPVLDAMLHAGVDSMLAALCHPDAIKVMQQQQQQQ